MQKNNQNRKRIIGYLPEIFLWLLLVAVWGVLAGAPQMGAYEKLPLYEAAAELMSGKKMPPITYHVSYAYIWMLSAFMSFLGTKWTAVAALWLFLQAAMAILWFRSVRCLFGRTASAACLLFLAVLSKMLWEPEWISPGLLTGILFGLAAASLSAVKAMRQRKYLVRAVLFAMLAAFFAGMAVCFSNLFDCLTFAAVFALCAFISGIGYLLCGRKSLPTEIKKEQRHMKEKATDDRKETEEETDSKTIQYIPNPLPLPKKHVKREIKFDYEPPAERMQFDYEMKKGQEDFDI